MPRLESFYRDVLGLPVEGDAIHAAVASAGASLAFHAARGMEELAPGSMGKAHGPGDACMLDVEVADVDAAHARLAALGVPIVKAPMAYPWGRRSAWFRDPDGNIVNLYEVIG